LKPDVPAPSNPHIQLAPKNTLESLFEE